MGVWEGSKWSHSKYSVPPHRVSLAAPRETRVWLPVTGVVTAQGKDITPEKEIEINPNYWILSVSCKELNREGHEQRQKKRPSNCLCTFAKWVSLLFLWVSYHFLLSHITSLFKKPPVNIMLTFHCENSVSAIVGTGPIISKALWSVIWIVNCLNVS